MNLDGLIQRCAQKAQAVPTTQAQDDAPDMAENGNHTTGAADTAASPSGAFATMLDAAEAKAAETERMEQEAARFAVDTALPRVRSMALSDFKRDLEQKNTLIKGGWGKRGGISMFVSTTGTGKSVVQTQAAVCFALGQPCCGLSPLRPFNTWVIQSEDDEDRVAFDRDGIAAHLRELHPQEDWERALREVQFLDFTGITGARFVETLNNELNRARTDCTMPDALFINPMNAYFGGNLKDGADVSAFFKGGEIRHNETEGLEAVLKRHSVWCLMFAHTPKPPTSKELKDWLADEYPEYKMCGASEIADAVRSVITFLKVPEHDGVFAFTAGKNGKGLGWTDSEGNPTNRAFYRWAQTGGHFWERVPDEELPTLESATAKARAKPTKAPPPPRDETEIVKRVFADFNGVIDRGAAELEVRNAVNADRRKARPIVKDIGRNETHYLLTLMTNKGVITICPKGTGGRKGCMCGLPEVVDAWLKRGGKA